MDEVLFRLNDPEHEEAYWKRYKLADCISNRIYKMTDGAVQLSRDDILVETVSPTPHPH